MAKTSRRNVRRESGSGDGLRARREIVIWTLIVALGALATQEVRALNFAVAKPQVAHTPNIAEMVVRARIGSSSLGPETQRALTLPRGCAPPRPGLEPRIMSRRPPSTNR